MNANTHTQTHRLRSLLSAALLAGLLMPAGARAQEGQEAPELAFATPELLLETNQVHVLRTSAGVRLLAPGNRNVARVGVSSDRRKVIITAAAPGSTDLRIDLDDGSQLAYRILVVKGLDDLYTELKGLFAGIEGLNIIKRNPYIVLNGELFRVRDYDFVKSSVAGLTQVKFDPRVSSTALKLIAEEIERRIDVPGVHAELQGQRIILSGRIHDAERRRALAIGKEFGGSLVEDALVLSEGRAPAFRGKQVHLVVTVAEIERDRFTRTGIDWPAGLGLSGQAAGSVGFQGGRFDAPEGQITGTLQNFLPSVQLSSEDGGAHSVSTLNLSCRSGDTARSRIGGEVPVRVAQSQGVNTVEFVEHGLFVEIEPLIDSQDDIDMQIKVELKLISGESDSGPSFLVQNVDTAATLRPGETFVLAGFVGDSTRQALRGIPGLSRLPVLGRLFSSKRFQKNQTDLVIFVTPEVRDSGSGNTPDELAIKEQVLSLLKAGSER